MAFNMFPSDKEAAPASSRRPNKNIVHMDNLTLDITDEGILNACQQFGEVILVNRIHSRACLVTFNMPHEASLAIQKINADPSLGWIASHKKNTSNSNKSSGGTSDSESSLIVTPLADGGGGRLPSKRIIELPIGKPDKANATSGSGRAAGGAGLQPQQLANLNWGKRSYLGPFSQPVPVVVARGASRLSALDESHGSARVFANSLFKVDKMKALATASGGVHSKTDGSQWQRPEEGPCNLCQTISTAACDNCGDFYCSVDCQRADWPQHRRICYPMPRLVSHSRPDPASAAVADSTTSNGASEQPTPPPPPPPAFKRAAADATTPNAAATSSIAPPPPNKPATTLAIPRLPPPRNNTPVCITFATDHRRMFIRSAERATDEQYLLTLNAINEAGLAATQPLQTLPERSHLVLARYEEIYCRALVLAVRSADAIDVAYIDFGNKEQKRLAELWPLPVELYAHATHPVEVLLADVPEHHTTDAEWRLVRELTDNSTELRLHFDPAVACTADGQLRPLAAVRLIDPTSNVCINEQLGSLNRVAVVAATVAPIMIAEVPHSPAPVGQLVDLLVLDNSLLCYNMLSAIRAGDRALLAANNRRFQEYCTRASGPYTPRVDEVCLALAEDGQWYRAVCVEVVGDRQPTMQFVDYGNVQMVAIERLRKMPEEFAFAVLTTEFVLGGLVEVEDAMLPVLAEFFAVGRVVRADSVEVKLVEGSDVYVVHCEAMLARLREEKVLA